jgi:uncharacterized protein (UPF0335 family)
MANEVKVLTQEEFIEKIEKLESELNDARNECDLYKRMYERAHKKLNAIKTVIEL